MSSPVPIWLRASSMPEVVSALDALYADVGAEITGRGPVCWASGRCCNFERAGHRLYATGLETAYTISRLPPLPTNPPLPAPSLAPAAPSPSLLPILPTPRASPRPLTGAALADALARGTCPFQLDNLCSIHPIRPLGCRVYFCDRSAQTWQNDLYERSLAQLRAIHEAHAIPYLYTEWRAVLGMFIAEPG